MGGLTGLVVVLCWLHYSDAAIVFTGPGTVTSNAAAASVAETSSAGDVLFAFTATEGTTPTYVFAADGNPGSVAVLNGKDVKLAASKSIDFETMTPKTLIFKITGNDTGNVPVTLTVTLTITNRLEFAKTSYDVCVADGTVAGTLIGTYTVYDAVTGTDVVTYSNAANTDLTVDASTGALKVATGKTLTSATSGGYTTTITAGGGSAGGKSADGKTVVKVTVGGCSGVGQIQFMTILLLIPLLIARIF